MPKTTQKQHSIALIDLAAAQHDLEVRITELTELVQSCLEARMALEEGKKGAVAAVGILIDRSRAALERPS